MLSAPASKYPSFPPVHLPDRKWPQAQLTRAPIWMSTDLRDGNQSLFEPMNGERKMRMFKLLCAIGVKEIEVAFPSASQTDFDFVRTLIEGDHIPSDVCIEVLSQAREHLIRRTFESLRGAKRAIVHIYNATAPVFRETVFGMGKDEVLALAVESVLLVRELANAQPETEWTLEYSPEVFSGTELAFSLAVCNAVTAAWGATPQRKVILNLPATVEMSTPNVYADQIEWMHRHLERRDSVVLSLHPHNDRGTAVAAAELGLMAGADRVEGCLLGNGERTGNVDLVTLALNLYTQGVAPGLDFSDVNEVVRTVEYCTQLPVHPRHPYVGDLVFTAFSGSHQDAIKKGLAVQQPDAVWRVPYLPMDPADVGRSYASVIRVNSQSGKGGVAYLLENHFGIQMPRRLQVAFSSVVQAYADQHGSEVSAQVIWDLFDGHYLQAAQGPLQLLGYQLLDAPAAVGDSGQATQGVRLDLSWQGQLVSPIAYGNGPIDAAVQALAQLGIAIQVHSFEERSTQSSSAGGNAQACAFVELVGAAGMGTCFGVGLHTHTVTASVRALLSAVNRLGLQPQSLSQSHIDHPSSVQSRPDHAAIALV